MKQLPTFDAVCVKIFEGPEWPKRLLIGGLLSFLPILNIFALGLLYRFGRQVVKTGHLGIPAFKGMAQLFKEGLWMLLIAFFYMGVPVAVLCLASQILNILSFGLLGRLIVWLPVSIGLALAPPLFVSALYSFLQNHDWKTLLDWKTILSRLLLHRRALMVPTLASIGVLTVGLPAYGIAIFAGFLVLMGYYFTYFNSLPDSHDSKTDRH